MDLRKQAQRQDAGTDEPAAKQKKSGYRKAIDTGKGWGRRIAKDQVVGSCWISSIQIPMA